MPAARLRLSGPQDALTPWLRRLRSELELPEGYPPEAVAEAERSAAAAPAPPVDLTDVPFVTIDPPGSRDLDQALALARRGDGFRVQYAIAHLAAFVPPGGALDAEVHRRGVTVYTPDGSIPLHPPVLAHDAASLVADETRPAIVWQLDLDSAGELTSYEVRPASVRSRARLDYAGVQRALDDGTADEQLQLLREVGLLREERERARGGASLDVPEQEVVCTDGRWELAFRAPAPVEGWNAQISLLTGMTAAAIMLEGGVGLLRTLPPPPQDAIATLRRSAAALGVPWADGVPYPDFIRSLDAAVSAQASVLSAATKLFRGSGYAAFDGAPPADPVHAAVAAPYAHATAPLRRLGDRYVLETCVALFAGRPVPDDVRAALPLLPEELAGGIRRANEAERAALDLAEAVLLHDRVGQEFAATVVAGGDKGGTVQLVDPAVRAPCDGTDLPVGESIRVRLAEADPETRTVRFVPA